MSIFFYCMFLVLRLEFVTLLPESSHKLGFISLLYLNWIPTSRVFLCFTNKFSHTGSLLLHQFSYTGSSLLDHILSLTLGSHYITVFTRFPHCVPTRWVLTSGVFRISKSGAKYLLDTSAHTKGGAKPSFPIFLLCKKKIVWPKGGHGPMAPLNTPLVLTTSSCCHTLGPCYLTMFPHTGFSLPHHVPTHWVQNITPLSSHFQLFHYLTGFSLLPHWKVSACIYFHNFHIFLNRWHLWLPPESQ